MKFLPNFEGFRLTPLFAPIFLTKDVLYLLSHNSILSFSPIFEGFRLPRFAGVIFARTELKKSDYAAKISKQI